MGGKIYRKKINSEKKITNSQLKKYFNIFCPQPNLF